MATITMYNDINVDDAFSPIFAAVGYAGTAANTTTDTTGAWTARTLPTSSNWNSVCYGNKQIVAIAQGIDDIATSPDGTTWTARTNVLPASVNWQSVIYGTRFVAVANGSTSTAVSTDGITWISGGVMPSSAAWYCLAYGESTYVAVSTTSSTAAAYSTDAGANWWPATIASGNWQSVCYGKSVFVAVSYGSSNASVSTDGTSWTTKSLPSTQNWSSVTWGNPANTTNGVFVAVAYGTAIGAISEDLGDTWTQVSLAPDVVVNGDFLGSYDGWTLGTNWSYASNKITHAAGSAATVYPTTTLTVASGLFYEVKFDVLDWGAGTVTASIGGVSGTARGADGTYTQVITATGTGNLTFTPSSDFVGSIDNVSVRFAHNWNCISYGTISTQGVRVFTVTAYGTTTGMAVTTVSFNGEDWFLKTIASASNWKYHCFAPVTWNSGDTLSVQNNATIAVNTDQEKMWKVVTATYGKLQIRNESTTNAINFMMGRVTTLVALDVTIAPASGAFTIDILGDWISLGTGTGVAGQTFTSKYSEYVPSLWVETGNNTNVFEIWNNVTGAFGSYNKYFGVDGLSLVGSGKRGNYFVQSAATNPIAIVTLTGGVTTNQSYFVTCTSTAGVHAGASIMGPYIPLYTTVVNRVLADGVTLELNAVCTGTSSSLTFVLYNPVQSQTTTTLTVGDGVHGNVVPSGARVRQPNIMFSDQSAAVWKNADHKNNAYINMIGGGVITAQTCYFGNSYLALSQAASVYFRSVGFSYQWALIECYAVDMDGIGNAAGACYWYYAGRWIICNPLYGTVAQIAYTATTSNQEIYFSYIHNAVIKNWHKVVYCTSPLTGAASTIRHAIDLSYTDDAVFENIRLSVLKPTRAKRAFNISNRVYRTSFTNLEIYGCPSPISLTTSDSNTISGLEFCQTMFGHYIQSFRTAMRISEDADGNLMEDDKQYYFKTRSFYSWLSRDTYGESAEYSATPFQNKWLFPDLLSVRPTESVPASVTFNWTQREPTAASVTAYEIHRSTSQGFTTRDTSTAVFRSPTPATVTFANGPRNTVTSSATRIVTFAVGKTLVQSGAAAVNWATDGYAVGDIITVSGTALNDGTYTVNTVNLLSLTVNETCVAEVADDAPVAVINGKAPTADTKYYYRMRKFHTITAHVDCSVASGSTTMTCSNVDTNWGFDRLYAATDFFFDSGATVIRCRKYVTLFNTPFYVGAIITGTGIPADTTIISIDAAGKEMVISKATTTSATNATITLPVQAGMAVALLINRPAAGLPYGTTVASVESATSLTLSQAATADYAYVPNGTFTGGYTGWTLNTGWSYGTNNVYHTSGILTLTPSTPTNIVIGGAYTLTYTVSNRTAGTITPNLGGVAGTGRTTNGTFIQSFTATTTGTLFFTPDTTFNGTIDDVSIGLTTSFLPFTESAEFAVTPTAYPTAKNFCLYSRDLTNGAWAKSNVGTPVASFAPPSDATWALTTACSFASTANNGTLTQSVGGLTAGLYYSASIWVRADHKAVDVVNGTFTGNATGWTLNAGWAYNSNNVNHTTTGTGTMTPSTALRPVIGQTYIIYYRISAYTSGSVTAAFGGASGTTRSATGYYQDTVTASTNDSLTFTPAGTGVFTMDDIWIGEAGPSMSLLVAGSLTWAGTSTNFTATNDWQLVKVENIQATGTSHNLVITINTIGQTLFATDATVSLGSTVTKLQIYTTSAAVTLAQAAIPLTTMYAYSRPTMMTGAIGHQGIHVTFGTAPTGSFYHEVYMSATPGFIPSESTLVANTYTQDAAPITLSGSNYNNFSDIVKLPGGGLTGTGAGVFYISTSSSNNVFVNADVDYTYCNLTAIPGLHLVTPAQNNVFHNINFGRMGNYLAIPCLWHSTAANSVTGNRLQNIFAKNYDLGFNDQTLASKFKGIAGANAWPIAAGTTYTLGTSAIDDRNLAKNQCYGSMFNEVYYGNSDNLVDNGDFTHNASGLPLNWTLGSGWTYASAKVTHTASGGTATVVPNPALSVTATKVYDITYKISGRSAGTITVSIGGVDGTARSTSGTFTERITATTTGNLTFTPTTTFDGTIDDVRVYVYNNYGALAMVFEDTQGVKPYTYTGTPRFSNTGYLYMPTVSDTVTITWPWKIKGVIGFRNLTPRVVGANFGTRANNTNTLDGLKIEYKVNNYATWKRLNTTNLVGEGILDAVNGFDFAIKLTPMPFMMFSTQPTGTYTAHTAASPGVITTNTTTWATGQRVLYTTTGNPFGGLTNETFYYLIVVSTTTFQLSLTVGGAGIALTSATGSGVHTFNVNFAHGDQILGALSFATATVDEVYYDSVTTGTLTFSAVDGSWVAGENIRTADNKATLALNVATNGFALGPSYTSYINALDIATNVDQTKMYDAAIVTVTLTNIVPDSVYYIFDENNVQIATGTAEGVPEENETTIDYPVSVVFESEFNISVNVRKSSAPIRYLPYETGSTVTSAGANVFIAQVVDSVISGDYGAIGSNWTVYEDKKIIKHTSGTTVYSVNQLYSWLLDYFDNAGYLDDEVPISASTPVEYKLIDGWYLDNASTEFLSGGSISTDGWDELIYVLNMSGTPTNPADGDIGKTVQNTLATHTGMLVDFTTTAPYKWYVRKILGTFTAEAVTIVTGGTGAGTISTAITGETVWSNIFTLGSLVAGTVLDVYQNDVQLTRWWATSGNVHIDILVKVQESGVENDSGNLTVLARMYGSLYDHFVIDASSGRNPVPLAAFIDGNNPAANEATVAALATYIPDENFDFGYASKDMGAGGKPYDVVINCNYRTLLEIYEYLKYVTRSGSTTPLNGVAGEYYTGCGDVRFNYNNEDVGAFVEGELITGTGGARGYLVSLLDSGSTGTMVLRNVHGTFTNTMSLLGATNGATANVNGTVTTITPQKQAPFGSYAGGTFFGARGVWLDHVASADANNYQLIDSLGDTQQPPASVAITVSGLVEGDKVAVFRTVGNTEVLDKTMYYSDASANQITDTTFVVGTTIESDTPASGKIRVVDRDSTGKILGETTYAYSSWTGSTFTLSEALIATYNEYDSVYVPYIDTTCPALADSVSVNVSYNVNHYVVTRVRHKGIVPFTVTGELKNTGLPVTAIRTEDTIVT